MKNEEYFVAGYYTDYGYYGFLDERCDDGMLFASEEEYLEYMKDHFGNK